jgi:hypothetical protein
MPSFEMLRNVALVRTDVSALIRVTKICDLGTLAACVGS